MTATRPTVSSYLRELLRPFFAPWWAVFTGVASVGSWLGIPITGVQLPAWLIGVLVCLAFAGGFLLVSVLYQGWRLYRDSPSRVTLLAIQTSSAYAGEHVVLLSCGAPLPEGTLLELTRTVDGIEIPIALVEVKETNSAGQLQAHPLWFGSVHLNELKRNTLNLQSVRASTVISVRATKKANEEWNQAKAGRQ
ncbi:MAG: hypothetical protein V1790_10305 [Planctomycetota bacterium]